MPRFVAVKVDLDRHLHSRVGRALAFERYFVSRETCRINSTSPPAVPNSSPTMLIHEVCIHRSISEPSSHPATVPPEA